MRLAGLLLVALAVMAVAAIGLSGLSGREDPVGSSPPPSGEASTGALPPPTGPEGSPSADPSQLDADEQAFADAYLALAAVHDSGVVELLIANPLAEFDLVGVPLTDLVDLTRQQLADLPPLAATAEHVAALDREMAATVALLRAIEPHGPRRDMATSYTSALDYWIDHVRPESEAIRTRLALPPVPFGDLQL